MPFNVESFLHTHRIPFITQGVNVKLGEYNIKCPFCHDDPSYHCGIDPINLRWSCWRNNSHRGKTLHYLIYKLLNCSYDQVSKILGSEEIWVDEDFWKNIDSSTLFKEDSKKVENDYSILEIPKEFKPFKGYKSQIPFEDYLISRGFDFNVLLDFVLQYNLRYTTQIEYDPTNIFYRFSNRIIFPLTYKDKLVNFTGRSILPNEELRYYSLSSKKGALISIRELIFNFDELKKSEGDKLYVCEGPFDAVKLDFFGKSKGARATCFFGKNYTQEKLWKLVELCENYKKLIILLDNKEIKTSLELKDDLAFLSSKVVIGHLPENVKDPGDLSAQQVYDLIK